MDIMEAMKNRHSVRQYEERALSEGDKAALGEIIAECNTEGDLHIQLITDEPKAFDCMIARYGSFKGVTNYIALIGKKGNDLDEKCGYFGEKIVLRAQQLGLNTCWVAMSYKKVAETFVIDEGEKLTVVISIGYGANQGKTRKSKNFDDVACCDGEIPDWFKNGVEAALLAPTAVNQQKFKFVLNGNKVTAKAGISFYTKMDLGIAKYHFELGAGKENFNWA